MLYGNCGQPCMQALEGSVEAPWQSIWTHSVAPLTLAAVSITAILQTACSKLAWYKRDRSAMQKAVRDASAARDDAESARRSALASSAEVAVRAFLANVRDSSHQFTDCEGF
jgi:hypothetical protein